MNGRSSKFSIFTNDPKKRKVNDSPDRNNNSPSRSYPQHSVILSHYIKHKNSPLHPKNKKNLTEMAGPRSPKGHDDEYFEKKQKQIIAKLLKTKIQRRERKRRQAPKIHENLVLKRTTIADFESLQFEILKPTDKFFQKLQNVRLAQKILLAKPSIDLNRDHLSTFYKQQKSYQMNIRKMPIKHHSTGRNSKGLSQKTWID